MKDFAGNELEIGMKVICLTAGSSTSWMIWAEIIGFTPQKVQVEIKKSWGHEQTVRDPENVVLPLTPDTFYAIQQEAFASATYHWEDHVEDNPPKAEWNNSYVVKPDGPQ